MVISMTETAETNSISLSHLLQFYAKLKGFSTKQGPTCNIGQK